MKAFYMLMQHLIESSRFRRWLICWKCVQSVKNADHTVNAVCSSCEPMWLQQIEIIRKSMTAEEFCEMSIPDLMALQMTIARRNYLENMRTTSCKE